MVTKISPQGLIATTLTQMTPPLDDLRTSCGWPLLLEANPRRLAQELSLHRPECVLFWLEDRHGVAPTARLVEWSRKRGARPYRVAVAFHMEADVEAVFRAAGAHSFVPIAGRSASAVTDALWPLLRNDSAAVVEVSELTPAWAAIGAPFTTLELPVDLMRPP